MHRVFGLLFTLAMLCSVQGAEPSQDSIDTIKQNIADKKAVLIDVREPGEWNQGHLQDAASLPMKKIRGGLSAEELEQVAPKSKIVYLHCASGFRSLEAAKQLDGRHPDLRALKQGYTELLKAGFAKAK